jgi:lipopolysaccharide export LptBFGC system permease protein LptF
MLSRERRLRVGVAVLRYGIAAALVFVVFVVLRGFIVTAKDQVMWPLTAVLLMAGVAVGGLIWLLVTEMRNDEKPHETREDG